MASSRGRHDHNLDLGIIDWRDVHRLQHLLESWRCRGVARGADAIAQGELDPWQQFAHDLVARRDREGTQAPIRCIVIGAAGTGKSRTVRSIAAAKRSIVKKKLEDRFHFRVLRKTGSREGIAEVVRHCCRVGVPTACAAFQSNIGATTLHRLFRVPVGFCGPVVDRTSERYRIIRDRMRLVELYVLDDMSMIGSKMLGKIEFKLRDYLGHVPAVDGSERVMGGKDVVLCGDVHACPPVGDSPIYRDGEYAGPCENKPFLARCVPPRAWSARKLVRMGLTIRDSFEDVVILREVHRVSFDAGESVQSETRALYAEEAAEFLRCTRAMADCTLTLAQWDWLARRNRSVLQSTAEGRAQLERLDKAPLLVDGLQAGADRVNELRLQELSARTDKPVVALVAYHARIANHPDLNPSMLEAINFRGMPVSLLMCEGARVMLTDNIWIEAGLAYGALGTLKRFVWPDGGDANSSDPTMRTPLAVIVEFDEVNLEDESGVCRTFFPGEIGKARWVPVFRKTVYLIDDEGVCRTQFPLVLAWAMTYWQAQGMTLAGARVNLSERRVRAGLASFAVTRVRHPWDLVFEDDLPEYEHFMQARCTPNCRRRRRWELRLQQRASATLRKYGYCMADQWTKEEGDVAEALLLVLERSAAERRKMLCSIAGRVVDGNTWLWGQQEPCYEDLLSDACRELVDLDTEQSRSHLYWSVSLRLLDKRRRRVISSEEKEDAHQLLCASEQTGHDFDSEEVIQHLAGDDHILLDRYVKVASLVRRRLAQVDTWDCMIEEAFPADLGELHLPAVKWAVGALIPDLLHERFDDAAVHGA